MAGLGSSKWMSASKTQQGSDGQMGAGAPVQTVPSLELSLVQGLRSSGNPSHLPHIGQNFDCHEEPLQQSCFPRVGRPLERTPSHADHEFTAATAQPSTPIHQPRDSAQTDGDRKRKAQRHSRMKSRPVKHTEQNDREIQKLEPHLRSLIRFYFGNSEALQVLALNRILDYLQQHPPIHICRVERKNGDPRGMILLVICLLCPLGTEAPSQFKLPNALAKFAHHFRTIHCDIKNPFGCVVHPCDRSFSLRHDMTRHVKAAHPDFDGTARDIEDDIPDSVVASNADDPSNTRHTLIGSSPVVAWHNTSPFPSSIAGPSRRMNPYTPQPNPSSSNQDWTTMNPGAVSAHGTRPPTGHQAGYMTSENAHWVGHPSSNRSTMAFHDAHVQPYGGLFHISASGSNLPADYLHSHAQTTRALSPFPLDGNPGGTPLQIQSHQPDPSTIVAQMALPVTSNYPTNATAEGRFAQPPQNRMPSSSVQGPRQHMPTRAVALQWYDSNGASTSTRHAQAPRHEVDDMTIGSAGLEYLFSEQRDMQPGSQDLSTSSQMRHAGSIQQQQHPHPLQNQVDATLNHNQHTLYPPWELPPNSLNMGSWTFTRPSLDPRYPSTSRQSQTNRTRTKPPHYLGDNVSLDIKTLKGGVERSFRNLLSWLGLIGLMVGVSEAFLSATLVLLGPPRERKRCISSF